LVFFSRLEQDSVESSVNFCLLSADLIIRVSGIGNLINYLLRDGIESMDLEFGVGEGGQRDPQTALPLPD
jgi:hypothetical protein